MTKLERRHARLADREFFLEAIRTIITDPVLVAIGALSINELAYKHGFYDPRGPMAIFPPPGISGPPGFDDSQSEQSQSALGGPVWFTIGSSLPVSQQKRNFIAATIVGISTARALASVIPLKSMSEIGALIK